MFLMCVVKHRACYIKSVLLSLTSRLFFTQVHHFKIREYCADFIERNEDLFEKLTDDLNTHLESIQNPKDYPGPFVLDALSKLYKKNFLIYQEVGEPPNQPVDNGHRDTVLLAMTDGMHYDTVYPKSYLSASALCQSIVYEILYKRVFKFGECVDMAVSKMLHDKAYSKQRRCHLLNQSFMECFKLDDNEEDKPNGEHDAEAEIKKALTQGMPPFPYKVAKALDPLIYRNVEYDIWNEKRKEQMKNEQLVTPDIAPGVKCFVHLRDGQKDPFVAYIQELTTEQGPVTVYIEELCKMCTVPLDCIEIAPVPAYKEKNKIKKKYIKRGPVPNLTCLASPGCTLPEQTQETLFPSQRSRTYSGKQFSVDENIRSSAQHSKWRTNRQNDTSFYRSLQTGCQNQNEKIPRNASSVSPANFVQGSYDPEICHATATFTQPWRQPSQVFQTQPIAIPVKAIDNLHRSQGHDIPVAAPLKDVEWGGEASSLAGGSPSGFSPLSFVLYPCDSVSCISSEYSSLGYETNSPSPLTPSPPQIPGSQPVPVPQSNNENGAAAVSAIQASSGSPLPLYPCPVYTGMLVMYGDGSVHPLGVSTWRQEYPTIDNTQGLTSFYYNSMGTPPNCISPPLTQWVPAPPAAGYGTHWSTTGSALASSSLPGEISYPTAVYGTPPPWNPPSGFVVQPPPVSFQMPPAHAQFLPLQQQMQSAGQKPPA